MWDELNKFHIEFIGFGIVGNEASNFNLLV